MRRSTSWPWSDSVKAHVAQLRTADGVTKSEVAADRGLSPAAGEQLRTFAKEWLDTELANAR
jgi:hypothetical protein